MTSFSIVYELFFSKITDDMQMEITEEETKLLTKSLLMNAIPWFEFARHDLSKINSEEESFEEELDSEEINILAVYMVMSWISQQLASVENTRLKQSGKDFSFTSQANHMQKLVTLKKEYEREGFHLQRLYKRRKIDKKGIIRSTFGSIMNYERQD